MSITITEAHRRYIDYHCYGNKLNTSSDMMGEIVHLYSELLSEWQTIATDDNNVYEFDDSDFQNWKEEGKEDAKETTGYKNSAGDKATVVTSGLTDVAQSVGVTAGAVIGREALTKTARTSVSEISKEVGKEVAGDAATEAVGGAGSAAAFIVGCTLGAVTAALYWAKRPNQEGKEACDKLFNELLPEQQAALSDSQAEMEEMAMSIEEASTEAEETNLQANETMLKTKAEYDLNAKIRTSIEAKVASGEKITEGQKSLYTKASADMATAGATIEDTAATTTETVDGIYSDMETYQEGYDIAAENMAYTEGITDYAEGLDKMTMIMCYVEGGAQTLNAVSSGIAAAEAAVFAAAPFQWWAFAFVALGAGGAIASGFAAKEQFQWAGQIKQEIGLREATQGLNAETMDYYDEGITTYEGSMSDVSALTLDIPQETEAPQNAALNIPEPQTAVHTTDDDKKELV